jgi:hypothetical protein
MKRTQPARLAPALCLLPLLPSLALGQAGSSSAVPHYNKEIAPLLGKYCTNCHSGAKPKGKLDLASFPTEADALKKTAIWEKIADSLRAGDMPPPGKPRPSLEELDRLNTWLDRQVFKIDCSGKRDPGRVTIHRLNRAEYNNTIRDLLGVKFQPANDFPSDDVGYGFDNIGDVLSMPPILMEKYLAAAEKIINEALKTDEGKKRILGPPLPEGTSRRVRGEATRTLLRNFASKAYRRPATDQEVRRLQALVETAVQNGDTPTEGVKLALQAVLVSPHFLFRIETDREPNNPEAVHPISEWELATRLSYFLWSSMPDEELSKAAQDGTLSKPEVLEAQVKRMLKDPKARALTVNFADQWLTLRNLKGFAPDPKQFPTFNESLRSAMLRETEMFFEHIVREDRSILEFLDGDYTFLNEQLARHYGISGVKGPEFRKVPLPNGPRAGILTQASILTVTSNPTRTSPVKRGKWVLENILGTPPPPPPPGVEELKEGEQVELTGSLRQRMEQHRANPSCASCHARMDALGFAFENFDAIGAWRTRDGKHPIDPAGELPGGLKFQGPADLRKVLKGKSDLFTRCLTEKLLTYALGRGMERSDRCYIEEIAKNTAKNGYKFTELVLDIVNSEPFQMRRGKQGGGQ